MTTRPVQGEKENALAAEKTHKSTRPTGLRGARNLMRLHEHLAGDDEKREEVEGRLLGLSQHSSPVGKNPPGALTRMVAMLELEHRLSDSMWEDLCTRLQAAGPDPVALCDAITEWGRAPGHALCSEATGLAADAQYAHLVMTSELAKWLRKELGEFVETEAVDWLRSLTKLDLEAQRRRLAGVRLREYTMWATFRPPDSSGDPVGHLPSEARRICRCLGLCRRYLGKDLIVVCYRLPGGTRPHIPTVATVACGDVWSEYWQPSPPGCPHGLTQPHAEYRHARSCPEVVHEPVTGDCLSRELRELPSPTRQTRPQR